MILDSTSEAIAHFIGLFNMAIEEGRMRKAFLEFQAAPDREHIPDPDEAVTPRVNTSYDFDDFYPRLQYDPSGWSVEGGPRARLSMDLPSVQVPPLDLTRHLALDAPEQAHPFIRGLGGSAVGVIEPPGSAIAIVVQTIQLHDDDFLSVGNHGLTLVHSMLDSSGELDHLLVEASDLSPLVDLSLSAESVPALIDTIERARDALADFQPRQADGLTTFVERAHVLDGIYVNGAKADAVPDYDHYRPLEAAEDPASDAPRNDGFERNAGHTAHSEAMRTEGLSHTSDMEITAGDNLLLNEVRLSNEWLASAVMAVGGDHIELNAIIQYNAWTDIDSIGSDLGSWAQDKGDPTLGFNIAEFKRIDPSHDVKLAAPDTHPSFPTAWAVTEIKGDLVILNWIEQFSFLVDNDITVMSAFGSKVTAVLGDNAASNQVSLQELGLYYDLIVVGGNVYDVNLIQQMNLLMDNDLVAGAKGFQTSGDGSVASHGNLLWNQANIVQVGSADRFSSMPEAYAKALADFQGGKHSLPSGVLSDPAFANLAGLRVLYISGDVVNLQYVKQVNVLGDGDQVVAARNQMESHSDAHWTVSTGANTLVNVASVVDVDGYAKTYVGGHAYSDEMLVQAEFVPNDPWAHARDPQALVSEAVVFLHDDMMGGSGDAHAGHPAPYGHAPAHAPHPDVMHTMLA